MDNGMIEPGVWRFSIVGRGGARVVLQVVFHLAPLALCYWHLLRLFLPCDVGGREFWSLFFFGGDPVLGSMAITVEHLICGHCLGVHLCPHALGTWQLLQFFGVYRAVWRYWR
eukprot:Gb_16374 [translate_table: standard]